MEIGIVGLGKMGAELAKNALENGLTVCGLTRGAAPAECKAMGLIEQKDLEQLVQTLPRPRKIFLYVPAGHAVEELVHKLGQLLEEGDIVIDGGNSYWGDSVRRHALLRDNGIHFLDMGTSGGIHGARSGACFMVGGDRRAFDEIAPVLEGLASEGAFAYVGPSGAGHLVKLIHNGIEFGMIQAIGEGMALLEKYRQDMELNMEGVFRAYRNGSVIRSWLVDLMHEQYVEQGGLANVPGYVEDTGEVNWLLEDALHLEVPIPVIAQSLMELLRSRDEKRDDYRSVAMMRHGFGGHPFGAMPSFRYARQLSRVRPDFPDDHLMKGRSGQ